LVGFNKFFLADGVVVGDDAVLGPEVSQSATPWNASTRLVTAVMVSRSVGSDRYRNNTMPLQFSERPVQPVLVGVVTVGAHAPR
jgi:hypothetical protein